jgi:hypothetical protein
VWPPRQGTTWVNINGQPTTETVKLQSFFVFLAQHATACFLVDAQQLHIEHQGGVGGDDATCTPLAVCTPHSSTTGGQHTADTSRKIVVAVNWSGP